MIQTVMPVTKKHAIVKDMEVDLMLIRISADDGSGSTEFHVKSTDIPVINTFLMKYHNKYQDELERRKTGTD